jgi:hypothetical protein
MNLKLRFLSSKGIFSWWYHAELRCTLPFLATLFSIIFNKRMKSTLGM